MFAIRSCCKSGIKTGSRQSINIAIFPNIGCLTIPSCQIGNEGNRLMSTRSSHVPSKRRSNFSPRTKRVAPAEQLGQFVAEASNKPTVQTYNNGLQALGKLGLSKECWAIFRDMEACGVTPNVESWNALLQSAKADSYLRQHTFSRMKALGVSPNAETFAALLIPLIEERHFEMCIQLLDEMPSCGLTPSKQTIERLVVALAQNGYSRLAIDFVDSFESEAVEKLSVDIWLDILESAASSYYEVGVDRGIAALRAGNIPLHEGLCLTVLNYVARQGKVELAEDVLQQLQSLGVTMQEQHFEPVIEAYLVMKDTKSALAIFYSMLQLGLSPSPATLRPLTRAVRSDADLLDSTFYMLSEFKGAGKPSSILPYNALLGACSRGDLKRAIGIFKDIKSKGIPPTIDTFNNLIAACVSQSNKDIGTAFWNELKELGIKPNYQTFESLIRVHLREGPDYEAAFFYLEEMKSYGITPGILIYEDFVKKCVRFNDGRLPLVLDEMKEMGYGVGGRLRRFMETGGKADLLEPVKPEVSGGV